MLDYLWVLLAAAGILLIAPWSNDKIDLIGVVFALLAGALWATYIILGGKISKIMKSGEAVATGMLFGTLVILPFGIIGNGFQSLTPTFFSLGLALALLSSAIPFTLEMKALGQLPARTFSILMSLEPAVASICGLLFLHEYLAFNEVLAVLFVIIASVGSTITSRKVTPRID